MELTTSTWNYSINWTVNSLPLRDSYYQDETNATSRFRIKYRLWCEVKYLLALIPKQEMDWNKTKTGIAMSQGTKGQGIKRNCQNNNCKAAGYYHTHPNKQESKVPSEQARK